MAGQLVAGWRVELLDWLRAAPRALPIRVAVFVQEQGVPEEIEHDEWDARSLHALAYAVDGQALGTGRLLPDGHIGRMAVTRAGRGQGVGSALLQALLNAALTRGDRDIRLHAQSTAAPFYSRHGFVVYGDEFMEAGILHVPMRFDQLRSLA